MTFTAALAFCRTAMIEYETKGEVDDDDEDDDDDDDIDVIDDDDD